MASKIKLYGVNNFDFSLHLEAGELCYCTCFTYRLRHGMSSQVTTAGYVASTWITKSVIIVLKDTSMQYVHSLKHSELLHDVKIEFVWNSNGL